MIKSHCLTGISMKKTTTILFFILSILLSGCGLTDRYLRSTLGDSGSDLPVFMDDFSDHDNGWLVTAGDNGVVHYDEDAMRILVREANSDYWTTPGLNLQDTITDVDAGRVTGPENNLYGLICRWQDQDNYYAFLVSSDNYYGIIRVVAGKREILSTTQMQVTDKLLPGTQVNHLQAGCIGSKLTLYLNWNLLVEVDDTTFTRGDVGLIASTLDEAGTDIRFDNFMVKSPE
jgi:hypothetical protein